MKKLAYLFGVLIWVAGIAVTPGFWPATATVLLPPYAYYQIVRKVMEVYSPELLP